MTYVQVESGVVLALLGWLSIKLVGIRTDMWMPPSKSGPPKSLREFLN